jgi:hypothetical protein
MLSPMFVRRCEWTLASVLGCGLVAALSVGCSASGPDRAAGGRSTSPATRTSRPVTPPTTRPATAPVTTPVTTPVTSPVTTTAGGHPDPYPALCRAIAPSDVQALFSRPLAALVLGGSSDCSFAPKRSFSDTETLRVYLRLHDADQTLWQHIGDIDYGTFAPLTGVGDQAKWAHRAGTGPTVVDVRTGTFTCTVVPASEPAAITMRPSGAGASAGHVPVAAARRYAVEVARICTDVFAAR